MARRIIRQFLALLLLCLCLFLPQANADPATIILAIGAWTLTAGAIYSAVATAVVGAVISFGISALAGAISKPKIPKSTSGSFGDVAGQRLNFSRNSVESRKVIYGRVRTSGPMVFVCTTDLGSRKNAFLHMVICLAGHECQEIETIYIDENAVTLDGNGNVTTTQYANGAGSLVRVKKYLGSATQTADPHLMDEVTEWTENHRLQGITYIYVRLQFDRDNFPNGVPQLSAIVKGKKLYDPRTTLTAYSANPALCVLDYLTSAEYGIGAELATEIDTATFIASANNCDEDVTLADGSTQKRYTCNGVLDTAIKPIDNLKDLSTSMAGVIPYVQGKFRCFSGYYTAPTVTIDESWLSGTLEIQPKKPRNELFNAVKGIYVAPDKGWQPTDFPMVTNATYETQDGGQRIIRDLELPFTIDPVETQRIAKILIEQGRQGIIVKMPCNFKALQLSIMDTVSVTIAQLGWTSKVFRVVQWELNIDGGFTLTLQEESSASYDWNNGEQTTIDPAPDTNLPDLFTVEPPGNPVVTEEIYETTDGSGVKTKAILTWAESLHGYVGEYVVDYKLATASDYTPAGKVDAGFLTLTIPDMAPGLYDFRVKAINVRGVSSEYAVSRREIRGLTDPPSDVIGFNIAVISNQAHLSWDQHPDLDVKTGGWIRLRWSANTDDATWSEGTDIAEALPGIATHVAVPAQAGTYMIKAYDSLGHESVNFNSVVLAGTDTVLQNSPISYNEYNGITQYPGTKTNLISYIDWVPSSPTFGLEHLVLDGIGNFDDAAGNFDDASGYFEAGGGAGFAATGSYIRNTYVNLFGLRTIRLSMTPGITVYDGTQIFDQADGLFDDREGLFDGTDRSDTYVDFYVKTTQSDPTGSTSPDDAIWSDWQKFFVCDLTCRAFWTKAVITNNKLSNGVVINNLSAKVTHPTRDLRFTSESIDAGGTTFNFSLPFVFRPDVRVVIGSAVSGDTVKTTFLFGVGGCTGVTVQILNGGSGVARTCDVNIRGY